MSANLKLINLMAGLLQPMLNSPNADIAQAAGEEMQELLKRRQKLMGGRVPAARMQAQPEGAGCEAGVAA